MYPCVYNSLASVPFLTASAFRPSPTTHCHGSAFRHSPPTLILCSSFLRSPPPHFHGSAFHRSPPTHPHGSAFRRSLSWVSGAGLRSCRAGALSVAVSLTWGAQGSCAPVSGNLTDRLPCCGPLLRGGTLYLPQTLRFPDLSLGNSSRLFWPTTFSCSIHQHSPVLADSFHLF